MFMRGKGLRFGRRAYERRIAQLADDMAWWKHHYVCAAKVADTPAVAKVLLEHAEACDSTWHGLDAALRALYFKP